MAINRGRLLPVVENLLQDLAEQVSLERVCVERQLGVVSGDWGWVCLGGAAQAPAFCASCLRAISG